MSNFSAAIQYVLDNEGGFSNDPADAGGATRYGITHAEAAAHGFDVDTLTLEQAKSIYEVDYWKFDAITDQRVATKLFDMCVNMGEATAIKMAQTAVGVPADGVMGPATAMAINARNPLLMLDALLTASVRHYASIVAAKPSQVVFLMGWINRALSLPT
jgi:lysozyme family protein